MPVPRYVVVDDDHLDGNVGQKQQQHVQREPPGQAEGGR